SEASMRPRLGGRGERPSTGRRCPSTPGFNAATAGRPWRTSDLTTLAIPHTLCFNAATAGRPWRTDEPEEVLTSTLALQCGHAWAAVENYPVRSQAWSWSCRLQCGHGWAAVENVMECTAAGAGSSRLQCGHGWAAVENRKAQSGTIDTILASM